MRSLLRLLKVFIILSVFVPATAMAEDYVLTINGRAMDIDLNQKTQFILPDGSKLELFLEMKEYLRFKSNLFSFEHKSEYKPNRNDLGDGVFQTMIVTPLGSGILIQEYMEMDPGGLIDLMLKELTKEEVEYGYTYKENAVKREVGRAKLSGKQAITSYRGEEWIRDVLSYGGKDRGILVITFIEKDNYETEMVIIEDLWRTLQLHGM